MNISKQLFELQKIDLQLDEWKARQNEIKSILADDSKIINSKNIINTLESKLTHAQKELKIAEYEVNEQIDKLKVNEGRLYGGAINSPKELEDLQMEAAAFKMRLSALEDTQLDCMMQFEEAEAYHDQSVKSHIKLIEDTNLQHEQLKTEHENLENEIDSHSPERASAAQTIAEEHLRLYEKIREKRKGYVVVEFKDSTCPACGAGLTSSKAQLARSPNTLTQCDSCSRIFFPN